MTTKEAWAKVRERLESLPAKRLGNAKYFNSVGDYCALGALARDEAKALTLKNQRTHFEDLGSRDATCEALYTAIRNLGLTTEDAEKLQSLNDRFDGSEEERYRKVLEYVAEKAK